MIYISIIGTARGDYVPELFDKMITTAKYMLSNLKDITLISGGAAWADHVAVRLYLEGFVSKLILHLPCEWSNEAQYYDNGDYDWGTNPGRTSNYYHSKFSQIIGINSLDEIDQAIKKGAEICIHKGFHERNNYVAKCNCLIGFTWSNVSGGTLDTWNKCSSQKYHIDLSIL